MLSSACPLCKPTEHDILWQDDFCRVVLLDDADYPGYCRLELISHIKEMTDLAPVQRGSMMKIVFSVEAALREVLKPDKVNLASLGNMTPHIHWHIVPRFKEDKHFPNSHWGEATNTRTMTPLTTKKKQQLATRISALINCN